MTLSLHESKSWPPAIIDVESSGLGTESYPIEIGVVLSSGEGYCSLVVPAPSWTHWDPAAEKIHGISRKEVLTYGKPIGEVARDLNRLLENQTVYSDGWVVDQPWITRLFYEASIPRRFFFSPLESILSEEQMAVWHEVKKEVITERKLKRHRASADAWIIQETYARTRNILSHNGQASGVSRQETE